MYDYTNAGDTDLGNGFKITMLGGKNYVPLMMELNGKVIGDVSNLAAFNTREQAETFIRNAELGGANLFAPHAGTLDQSWQFQQHTFAELFNLVLDNDILTPKELIDVFNNTIKDSKDNQKQFNQFATKYGEDIKNFDSFESDPKKIIDLLDIKNNYSPKLRKALNNAIASNKKFQQAIGVKNKNEFYNRIMDPLNQGMKGGEIMNIVDFDPTTFQIVETKPNNTDHHPSFGFALLAKINGIYQPTELVKSVDITDSYTKYNQDGEKTSRKAEEPKFEEKNVSSSAGAIPKTAEFNIPSTRKKQLIGKNAYLSKNVKDNLSVAKKMEADKKSPIDIRIATGWEKGVDNKWRYEIEDVKINNKLKELSKGVIQTKNTSTPIPLSQVISKSNPLLTAYPKLADTIVIVTEVVTNNKSVLGAHGLINGEDFILLKAIKDYDLMESILVHEIQHAIQEIEGFAKGTNVAETYKTKIALDRAVKLAAAEQKALDMNIAFLSKGINTYDKLWAYFVDYIKDNLTAEENYNYVINKLGGESNLDLSNDYVIEYLKENSIPGLKDKKSLINMFEAKKLYDQVSGDLGYLSTAGEVEARNVEARRKMSAKERLNTLLSETENIPRSRQIIEGKIARKKQISPKQNWIPTPVKNMNESPIAKNSDKVRTAAIDLIKGNIDQEDYTKTVEKYSPIGSIGTLFAPATIEHMELALGKKADKLMAPVVDENGNKLKKVGTRLDIPSYLNKNAWVVTVHDERIKNGPVVSYRNAVKLKNVEFSTDPRMALNIAAGLMGKSTFARMVGEMVDIPGNTAEEQGLNAQVMVEEIMNDPNWVQVGMNPFRHSFFWNRANGMPVVSADEVIQIGGLVYAKNAKEVSPNSDQFTVYGKYDESKNKVVASDEPMLDKSGKTIKFQKGLSKQEAIRKAKEKYVLSVKERGNTPEQGVTSALEDLRKSEWYNEADDLMREEAERELKKFFGEKMKAAPSIKKVWLLSQLKYRWKRWQHSSRKLDLKLKPLVKLRVI